MKTIYTTEYDFEEAKKEYKECNDITEEISDDRVYDFINDTVSMWYEDEKVNLNKEIDTDILAVANMGLWNGRRTGYKELSNNLKDIFSVWESCDGLKLYVEKGNVKGTGYHHDGTNYVTFRKWKDNISDDAKDKVLSALYMGNDATNLLKRYTRSIVKDVAKIYGW